MKWTAKNSNYALLSQTWKYIQGRETIQSKKYEIKFQRLIILNVN